MIKTGGRFDKDEGPVYFLALSPQLQQSYSKEELAMIRTGGDFNAKDDNVYFIASNVDRMVPGSPVHDYLLVAVNELTSDTHFEHLEGWLREGKKVFIDSGIFNLTMEHVRSHPGLSMDDALGMAPDEIDGFDVLFARYVDIVEKYGDACWGYIELDQGGRDNKIKTRARLEKMGCNPIPVYHPLNDGWDYFDYLAERYDRICFGNVVQATRSERLRLVYTAWDRHRKYPDLWIHLLGLTPNQWLYALPINSGDSSSWLSAIRWQDGYREQSAGNPVGGMDKNYQYKLGSDPDDPCGSRKATRMSAYGSAIAQRNWRNHIQTLKDLGCNIYPEDK